MGQSGDAPILNEHTLIPPVTAIGPVSMDDVAAAPAEAETPDAEMAHASACRTQRPSDVACGDILIFKSAPDLVSRPPLATHRRLDLSLDVAVVSDYRRNGMSRSGGDPAAQATLHFTFDHGWSGGVFTSTTDPEHSNYDVALFGAKKFTFGDTDLVFGATAVMDVDHGDIDFGLAQSSISHPLGPFDLTLSANYAWRQASLDNEDSLNVSLRGKSRIGRLLGVPLTLGASIGRTEGHFADDGVRTDWSASLTADLHGTDLGFSYVDNDVSGRRGRPALVVSLVHTF